MVAITFHFCVGNSAFKEALRELHPITLTSVQVTVFATMNFCTNHTFRVGGVTYHWYECNEIEQIVSWVTLTVLLQFITK